RVHTDNTQHVYVNFTNIGDNVKVNGTDTIARITLKAKQNITWDMEISNALLVDSKLNSKSAIAKIVDLESELPSGRPTSSKVSKENITVSGDSSQLQAGMGLDKLIDGTTSSDDSSRMDLKWIFTSDQQDKGTLPFEMTFEFNEPKTLENFTIYNRMNSNGTINIAAMKKVKAVGYLNGEEFDLGEKANITSATTVYELGGQEFDKIVITALDSHKDKNTLAINEIEFYEKSEVETTGISFAENTPESVYLSRITPIFAEVTPDNANNLNYRLASENPDILQVLRVDREDKAIYYLRGLNPGVAKLVATTAEGNHKVEKEIVVLDGIDKTLLTKAIEEAKSYESLSEIYTVESYEALLEAIKHAEEVLENSSSEKEIGDAIINLRSKISKLEERETVEEDKIDSSKLEAIYATSEADRDYKENAVDGDENTIWHSAYQAADKLPVSITIKLDKAYDLNQIDYLPRQNSRNGHVTEYKIETSLDNENWTEVRTGNLEVNEAGNALANRGYNPIRFNTINAQYVRFTALKTLGDTNNKYASAAELVFYGKEGKVSAESITLEKTELKLNVNESEQLKAVLNPIESNDTITWTSSDESIAKVDENGVITGIGKGEALITATIPNGKSATAKVIVEDSVSEEIIVSPVRDFKASQVNKRDVTVTWTTPESTNGLEGYILYRDGKKVAKLEADETLYMFNKLNRHTIYNFKVAA
ncbi:MAG: discoidin domain-containing protein, partial [Clostridium perfringens]|nr:discoidin domain-containing protein [Clostridium perfringens]